LEKDRGKALAERLRQSLEISIESRRTQANKAAERRARAKDERTRLFKDLFEFGAAMGHVDVVAEDGMISFGWGDRRLHFHEAEDTDVIQVTGDDIKEGTVVALHAELDLWVVRSQTNDGRLGEQLLFDTGLEKLMVRALAL